MERRRAKTLNFSIAYGKTSRGLAKDWGVSLPEAKETIDRWYSDRQEVRQWQQDTISFARDYGYVSTILGRRRNLPGIHATRDHSLRGHSQRAAINTPLQGSAADVVTAAMVKLHQNAALRACGWSTILQVHDEIILEGPRDSSPTAADIVRRTMEHPLEWDLLVQLVVDLHVVQSWYQAK
mmetsp:Transcript_11467/g.23289  ORF Transcript_11467/g.23289 Transcript_11467/m.23289 type:complete len:181 (+) Transcript_11467:2812-3354(+)